MTGSAVSAAERQRRHRERRRRGYFVVPVELGERHVDWLVAGGWLRDTHAADPKTSGEAVRRVLDALSVRPVFGQMGRDIL